MKKAEDFKHSVSFMITDECQEFFQKVLDAIKPEAPIEIKNEIMERILMIGMREFFSHVARLEKRMDNNDLKLFAQQMEKHKDCPDDGCLHADNDEDEDESVPDVKASKSGYIMIKATEKIRYIMEDKNLSEKERVECLLNYLLSTLAEKDPKITEL